MNYKAVALMAMGARAVGVVFPRSSQVYTYAQQKEHGPLEVGDQVIVHSPRGHVVVEVVDTDLEFDVNSDYDYKFILGKVEIHEEAEQAQIDRLDKAAKEVKMQLNGNVRSKILEKLDLRRIK